MDALTFAPYFRPQIWGSRRLATRLAKNLPADGNFGEAWELSAHPHHDSRVSCGPFAGQTLSELWSKLGPDFFGDSAKKYHRFPLLIKYLDCDLQLSVQVHPTDEIAARIIPGEWGKTETWLVLEAAPTGRIYAGLKPGVTPAELETKVADGTVADCLHSFQPEPGQCLLIPAGTVHAVGGGVLMAEVQQSSDATFRLFDWNRLDSSGKPRALHVRESLESIDWQRGPVNPQAPVSIDSGSPQVHSEKLCESRYFRVLRHRVTGDFKLNSASNCSIWMVVNGAATLQAETAHRLNCGETILLPQHGPGWQWQVQSDCLLLEAIPL